MYTSCGAVRRLTTVVGLAGVLLLVGWVKDASS